MSRESKPEFTIMTSLKTTSKLNTRLDTGFTDSQESHDSHDSHDVHEESKLDTGYTGCTASGARGAESVTWLSLSEQSIANSEEDHGWQSRTWHFTRYVKGLPEFGSLSADQAYRRILWDQTAFDEDDRIAFRNEWRKVRVPVGHENLVQQAAELAKAQPAFTSDTDPKFALFLSICVALQQMAGDGDFFFSTRDMAKAVGARSPQSISNYTARATDEVYLKVARDYPKGTRKAREYRFDLEKIQADNYPPINPDRQDDGDDDNDRTVPYQDWLVQPELVPILDRFADIYLTATGEEYEISQADLDILWGLMTGDDDDHQYNPEELESFIDDFAIDSDGHYVNPFPGWSVAGFGEWLKLRMDGQRTILRVSREFYGFDEHYNLLPDREPIPPTGTLELHKKWKSALAAAGVRP